ncbi:MAG: hypothetical protein QXE05_08110 [Nitrososphaeria archaeon]
MSDVKPKESISDKELMEHVKKAKYEMFKKQFGSAMAGEILSHLFNDALNNGRGLSIYNLAINKLKVPHHSYPIVLKTVKRLEKEGYLNIERTKKGERRTNICKLTELGLGLSIIFSVMEEVLKDEEIHKKLGNVVKEESHMEVYSFFHEYIKGKFEFFKRKGILSPQVAIASSVIIGAFVTAIIPLVALKESGLLKLE